MQKNFFQQFILNKIKFILGVGVILYIVYSIYQIYFYFPNIDFTAMQLKTLNNEEIQIDKKQLNSAIIVFFQTWCGSCVGEMNLVQRHYSEFKFTNIYFITDEPIKKVLKLKRRWQLDSLNIFVSKESLSSLGIKAFPTSYIVRNNKIVETHKGSFIDESNFEDELFHLKKILK